MNKKILLIGAGGHCKSVLDTLLNLAEYSEIGIIEKENKQTPSLLNIPIIGYDDDLPRLFDLGYKYAFITVGDLGLRENLFKILNSIGFTFPKIIDKTAIVSHYAQIDEGTFVGKKAIINSNAIIGKNVIINSGVIIEHDCVVKSFSHIAPGSVLCGSVEIGKNTHIGANSTVKQEIIIGDNSIIGISSAVTKNIKSNVIAYGNPCKERRTL
ncbi:acetyltransferase [bacterium]|nr:acetyltransferase [bacterium]